MAAPIKIKKGLDLRLKGAPKPEVVDAPWRGEITVCPTEFEGVKPRLKVKEGDPVKRGGLLFGSKRYTSLLFRSPAGGTIRSIVYGKRRSLERIVIDMADQEESETFKTYDPKEVSGLSRDEVLGHLLDTGCHALIKQRPFSRIADPGVKPKSIFVNGMCTAPFQADANVAIRGHEAAFQAGLDALSCLTDGDVHLCLSHDADNAAALKDAKNAKVHTFSGPHPSGNTSVHIQSIDPYRLGEVIWTIKATDLLLIGNLFLQGEAPTTRIVSVGGPGVVEEGRKYYRVRIGAPLAALLDGKDAAEEQRILYGDVLSGTQVGPDAVVRFLGDSITVIPEDRERHFMGWLAPGLASFSESRTFLSRWLRPANVWTLGTNEHGGHRAMVLTGLYDKYMPLNILVDYLVRAVIAHDTDEAIKLGILETAPEDFALCALVCPSKTDLVGIIRKGLDEIETEGI